MNPETPSFREGHGVEDMDIFRTVTHEQFMTVRRQSPSFSFVRKPLTQAEARRVVDKPSFCLPLQLRDFILEESYAFTKIRLLRFPSELYEQRNDPSGPCSHTGTHPDMPSPA